MLTSVIGENRSCQIQAVCYEQKIVSWLKDIVTLGCSLARLTSCAWLRFGSFWHIFQLGLYYWCLRAWWGGIGTIFFNGPVSSIMEMFSGEVNNSQYRILWCAEEIKVSCKYVASIDEISGERMNGISMLDRDIHKHFSATYCIFGRTCFKM